jgi:hypothetical protein
MMLSSLAYLMKHRRRKPRINWRPTTSELEELFLKAYAPAIKKQLEKEHCLYDLFMNACADPLPEGGVLKIPFTTSRSVLPEGDKT